MSIRSKDEVFLTCALALGTLSTCDRAKIGAIITYKGRAVSWGYNGAPPHQLHCDENNHGWGHADRTVQMVNLERQGCRNSVHAEANSIAFAARQGISTEGATLYVSQSPCLVCAQLIIAAGIERVVYAKEYRDRTGLDLLERAGIG